MKRKKMFFHLKRSSRFNKWSPLSGVSAGVIRYFCQIYLRVMWFGDFLFGSWTTKMPPCKKMPKWLFSECRLVSFEKFLFRKTNIIWLFLFLFWTSIILLLEQATYGEAHFVIKFYWTNLIQNLETIYLRHRTSRVQFQSELYWIKKYFCHFWGIVKWKYPWPIEIELVISFLLPDYLVSWCQFSSTDQGCCSKNFQFFTDLKKNLISIFSSLHRRKFQFWRFLGVGFHFNLNRHRVKI